MCVVAFFIGENMNNKYMELAIELAKQAESEDEVPVGCVIVLNDEVIATGYNTREQDNHVLSHAEINAIKEANQKLDSWRLEDCELYVTLEPCIMCAGAITQARIKKVVYGASDPKGGAYGSVVDVSSLPKLNHYPEVVSGILKEESETLLKSYFKSKRKKKGFIS